MERWVVRCEQDAWPLLARSLSTGSEALDEDRVVFEGWPRLDIRIEPGDGHGTPQILRALNKLQSAVYLGFALLKYGAPNARRLTAKERYPLMLRWSIEKGSTKLPIDLSGVANEFAKAAANRMNGAQAMRTVLASVLMISATAALIGYLFSHAEVRKEEIKLQCQRELATMAVTLSDNHTKQMQLLKQAYEQDRTNVVRFAAGDYIPWRPALLDVAPYAGTITINTVVVDAPVAKKVAKIATKASRTARKELAIAKGPAVIEAKWVTTVNPARQLEPPMRLGA